MLRRNPASWTSYTQAHLRFSVAIKETLGDLGAKLNTISYNSCACLALLLPVADIAILRGGGEHPRALL